MPRLVFRAAALRDLTAIATHIEHASTSRAVADGFVDRLIGYCEHIAGLPALMGRARLELHADYRSVSYRSYVIFLRYADTDGPRSHLIIANIIHGRRDLDAYFGGEGGNEAG